MNWPVGGRAGFNISTFLRRAAESRGWKHPGSAQINGSALPGAFVRCHIALASDAEHFDCRDMILTALRKAAFAIRRSQLRIYGAILALALAPGAPAQVTVTPTAIGDSSVFTVSGSDLLQTNLAGAAITFGNFSFFGTNTLGTLTDGLFGAGGTDFGGSVSFAPTAVVRFDFDLTASPTGYNVTEIRTYSGWDAGRDGQEYLLAYSVVAAPNTFIPLATVGPYDVSPTPTGNGRIMVVVADLLGGTLIGNVAAIQFTFTTFENTASAWREIDVITAVPEPAHAALLFAVVMVSALVVRRRRNGKHQASA
jgi:hypothetical protein